MTAPTPLSETLPQWQLDDLYSGRDDRHIEADLEAAATANDELAALEGQFLAAAATPAALGALLSKGIGLYETAVNRM